MFTSETEYVETMLRIADILKSRHEIVIFATTTPVSPKNIYNKNEDIRKYNALIVPKLIERGILINDLYSVIAPDLDRYISSDTIHLSPEGIERCAAQTANIIRFAAAQLGEASLKPENGSSADAVGAPIVL